MKILFVCTGNTCRSPMAEVVAREIFEGKNYEFQSAGISAIPEQEASNNAILAAMQAGLDLTSHRSKQIQGEMIESADLILTMTGGHKQMLASLCSQYQTPIFTLSEYAGEHIDIPDPFGNGLSVYQECISVIRKQLEKIYTILEA